MTYMVLNSIVIFVLLCGIMTITIAIYAWYHRFTVSIQSFSTVMFSLAIYIIGYSMELASQDLNSMLFWSKIEYIGILTFPTVFLVFTIQYTGHENRLSPKRIPLLFIIPIIFLILKFCDEQLHLIYASAAVDNSGIIPLLSFNRGPLYLLMTAYNLTLVSLGCYLLFQKRRSASPLYRKQINIILGTAFILLLVYGVYQVGVPIPGLPHLDLNPFFYTLWGVAICLAIFRYRLFDLTPVARDVLIEILSDGVVVLDTRSRVVDANPEALKIFDWDKIPIGQSVANLMDGWITPAWLKTVEGKTKTENRLTKGNETFYFENTISSVKDQQGRQVGHLVLIHDITQRKQIEQELHDLSLVDEMTGLTNRRGFKVLTGQLVNMTRRMKLNAVLIYIDLDGLKWINDNLGHAAGDQALIDTGMILKRTLRTSDIIARLGGDEFVVLAIESAENSGNLILNRLEEQLKKHNAQAGREYTLSFSSGMARYDWKNPQSMDDLLEAADKAMYEKKQTKKACRQPVY
jgi:diguanylate cyclase (GGDEF)-like protein/PAS domain S-box-containing protein